MQSQTAPSLWTATSFPRPYTDQYRKDGRERLPGSVLEGAVASPDWEGGGGMRLQVYIISHFCASLGRSRANITYRISYGDTQAPL